MLSKTAEPAASHASICSLGRQFQSAVDVSIALPAESSSTQTMPTLHRPEEYLIIAGYSSVSLPAFDLPRSFGSPNVSMNSCCVACLLAADRNSVASGVISSVYRQERKFKTRKSAIVETTENAARFNCCFSVRSRVHRNREYRR